MGEYGEALAHLLLHICLLLCWYGVVIETLDVVVDRVHRRHAVLVVYRLVCFCFRVEVFVKARFRLSAIKKWGQIFENLNQLTFVKRDSRAAINQIYFGLKIN